MSVLWTNSGMNAAQKCLMRMLLFGGADSELKAISRGAKHENYFFLSPQLCRGGGGTWVCGEMGLDTVIRTQWLFTTDKRNR